jgi:hypothetical protein
MWIMAMVYCATFSTGEMCRAWVPPVAESSREKCEANIKTAVYSMANAIEKKDGDLFFIDCQCIKVREEFKYQ